MKIVVIGGGGMAGHLIADYLTQTTGHEVWRTLRSHDRNAAAAPATIALDLSDESAVLSHLKQLKPHLIVNAAGLLNQHAENNIIAAIRVNSLLPQLLALHGKELGYRLIHISTDCVFSGAKGGYTETDPADAQTVYARTKRLGEVTEPPHLTIRTSIIGPEIKPDGIGLFHWFMNQTGAVEGYTQVYWNGVTTLELAKTISQALDKPLHGLVQLTGARPVSKYELLQLFKTTFWRNQVRIEPSDRPKSDKTLVNTRDDFAVRVPDYPEMLEEMKAWMQKQGARRYAQYGI